MLNTNRQMTIKWRDFEFPLSVTNFSIDETARVATYTYAGMDGALHERVMQYRTISVSGIFAEYSGYSFDGKTPSQYIEALQKSNDNLPGNLYHPTFGTYSCIIHSLKIKHDGEDNEADYGNNVLPVFRFDIEFWEMAHSTANNDLSKFYPAISCRPPNDLYKTNLKYHNCSELYQAIIDGYISPGLDPILNSEWLQYDQDIRTCAYDRYTANPKGETLGTTFNKKGNIVAATKTTPKSQTSVGFSSQTMQQIYTVKIGDTPTSIAKKFGIKMMDLYNMNKGREVRKVPATCDVLATSLQNIFVKQKKYWVTPSYLQAGDIILVPNVSAIPSTDTNLFFNV